MARRTTVKVRLNLKIDSDLRDWAVAYARRHGTTVTAVICKCLRLLRAAEEQAQEEYAEQI